MKYSKRLILSMFYGMIIYVKKFIMKGKYMIYECFGEICPIPFLKFERYLFNLKKDEKFTMIIDHSCAKVKIENYCKDNKIKFEIVEPLNGIWEITVYKN